MALLVEGNIPASDKVRIYPQGWGEGPTKPFAQPILSFRVMAAEEPMA